MSLVLRSTAITRSTPIVDEPATDPALLRTLAAAGLPATGRFLPKAGWVSNVWVGDEYIVRLTSGQFRDAYRHEATVVNLLAGSEVPHARHLAHATARTGRGTSPNASLDEPCTKRGRRRTRTRAKK